MVGYKLSKNDWVKPFFVIFRSVREILLVTVFFDHPVYISVHGLFLTVYCGLNEWTNTYSLKKRSWSTKLRSSVVIVSIVIKHYRCDHQLWSPWLWSMWLWYANVTPYWSDRPWCKSRSGGRVATLMLMVEEWSLTALIAPVVGKLIYIKS